MTGTAMVLLLIAAAFLAATGRVHCCAPVVPGRRTRAADADGADDRVSAVRPGRMAFAIVLLMAWRRTRRSVPLLSDQ